MNKVIVYIISRLRLLVFLFLVFSIGVLITWHHIVPNQVCLGNIRWLELSATQSILLDSKWRVLVKGSIELWTAYPYIVGMYENGYFMVDMRNNTVANFSNTCDIHSIVESRGIKWPKPLTISPYVTFRDLYGKDKLKEKKMRQIHEGLKDVNHVCKVKE